MTPHFHSRQALAIGVILAMAIPVWANPALSEKQAEEARQLVRQLGDTSFRIRDEASDKLVRMGSAVEDILREGLKSSDPEVRFRCRTILPMARSYDLERRLTLFVAGKEDRDNPAPESWAKFKEIVGDSRQSRQLLAGMHRFDSNFLRQLEDKPAGLQEKMATRCSEFAQSQVWGNGSAGLDEVALLLFASLEPRIKIDRDTEASLSAALLSMTYKPRGRDLLKGNDIIRKLLIGYLASNSDSQTVYNHLGLVANLELKEGVDFLKSVIKDSVHRQPYYCAMAISVLGKVGGKSSASDIKVFLADDTSVGEAQIAKNVMIKTKIRDVALASMVQMTGQDLRDYEFPYAKLVGARSFAGPNQHYMFNYLGFADDHARDAAFKKWSDWSSKNPDRLTK